VRPEGQKEHHMVISFVTVNRLSGDDATILYKEMSRNGVRVIENTDNEKIAGTTSIERVKDLYAFPRIWRKMQVVSTGSSSSMIKESWKHPLRELRMGWARCSLERDSFELRKLKKGANFRIFFLLRMATALKKKR